MLGLALIAALDEPQLHLLTRGRKVRLLVAAEAEAIAALARDGQAVDHGGRDGIAAAGRRTPLDVLVVVDERLHDEGAVLAIGGVVDEALHGRVEHQRVAVQMRALEAGRVAVVDLRREVLLPARETKVVRARVECEARGSRDLVATDRALVRNGRSRRRRCRC